MAITDYASLQAAVATFLVRSDQTATIPILIQLCESKMNRMIRERQAEMDVNLTSVPSSRFIPLPIAYSEALTAWITVSPGFGRQELRFVDPAALDAQTIVGQPYFWTIDGPNLGFERPCDKAYAITLRCIEKYALSSTVTTNTLLSDYPDVYLFGTLAEAGGLLRDQDLISLYEQKFDAAIASINAKDARSRAQQTLSTEPGQLTFTGRRAYNSLTDGFH